MVRATMDGAQRYQQIDGFGTNINGAAWEQGDTTAALDMLNKQLGSSFFRVILEKSTWEKTNDNDDPRLFDWEYYNRLYDTPKFLSLWNTLEHLERETDTQVVLSIMGEVPEWMGGSVVRPASEEEWVEMICSLLLYGRNERGLPLRLIAPLNESDWGNQEGPRVREQQYVRLRPTTPATPASIVGGA